MDLVLFCYYKYFLIYSVYLNSLNICNCCFQQITLQAFQGLGPGTQGHLLLKTENGQYQLLRVAAPSAQQSQTIAGNNINTFRVQTIAVSEPYVCCSAKVFITFKIFCAVVLLVSL